MGQWLQGVVGLMRMYSLFTQWMIWGAPAGLQQNALQDSAAEADSLIAGRDPGPTSELDSATQN